MEGEGGAGGDGLTQEAMGGAGKRDECTVESEEEVEQ